MGHDPRRAGPAPASGPPMTMPPTAVESLAGWVTVRAEDLRALLDAVDSDYLSTDDLPAFQDRIERLSDAVGPS